VRSVKGVVDLNPLQSRTITALGSLSCSPRVIPFRTLFDHNHNCNQWARKNEEREQRQKNKADAADRSQIVDAEE